MLSSSYFREMLQKDIFAGRLVPPQAVRPAPQRRCSKMATYRASLPCANCYTSRSRVAEYCPKLCSLCRRLWLLWHRTGNIGTCLGMHPAVHKAGIPTGVLGTWGSYFGSRTFLVFEMLSALSVADDSVRVLKLSPMPDDVACKLLLECVWYMKSCASRIWVRVISVHQLSDPQHSLSIFVALEYWL